MRKRRAVNFLTTSIWSLLFAINSAHGLVGGTVPPVISLPRYPATVNMVSASSRCTAVKVGAKTFLTAAHCIWNNSTNTKMSSYGDGQLISVTNVMYPYAAFGATIWSSLTIRSAKANPAFLAGCLAPNCSHVAMMDSGGDVALVEVVEDTPFIATGVIEYGSVATGTPIAIMGFGCEDGIGTDGVPGEPDLKWGRKKFHSTTAVDASFVTAFGFSSPAATFLGNYFFSPGYAYSPAEASLCPGDSGGPVVLQNTGELSVVGVNSYYGAYSPLVSWAISGYNTFARLDPIRGWLEANIR